MSEHPPYDPFASYAEGTPPADAFGDFGAAFAVGEPVDFAGFAGAGFPEAAGSFGADAAGGHAGGGYASAPEAVAAPYGQAQDGLQSAYGAFEEPAYGDEPPGSSAYPAEALYGDAGYGDAGAGSPAYAAEAVYPETGYGADAYAYEASYGEYAYEEAPADFAHGYEHAYDEGDPDDEAAAAGGRDGAATPLGERLAALRNPRTLALGAVGLLMVAALGCAGYFFVLAPSGGFDLAGLTKPFSLSLPFLGAHETDETRAAGQENAVVVKHAVESFARVHGELPRSGAAIAQQLASDHKTLHNPYKTDGQLAVELGTSPTMPGYVAYNLTGVGPQRGKTYEIRVADIAGKPLAIDGLPFVLKGRLGAQTSRLAATAPIGRPSPAGSPAPGRGAAVAVAAVAGGALAGGSVAHAAGPATPAPQASILPRPLLGGRPLPGLGRPGTSAAPSGQPTLPPVAIHSAPILKNQEFDRLRNRAIALIYEAKTEESVLTFKKALALRPNDVGVTRWLDTIQGAKDKRAKEDQEKASKMPVEAPRRGPTPVPRSMPGPIRGTMSDDEATRTYNELKRTTRVPSFMQRKADPG